MLRSAPTWSTTHCASTGGGAYLPYISHISPYLVDHPLRLDGEAARRALAGLRGEEGEGRGRARLRVRLRVRVRVSSCGLRKEKSGLRIFRSSPLVRVWVRARARARARARVRVRP